MNISGFTKAICLFYVCLSSLSADNTRIRYQTDFTPEEFSARRQILIEKIGPNSIAILQGAPAVDGFMRFRQTNEFYYFTGFESSHSYLILNGKTGKSTLFVQARDAQQERGQGKVLSLEDADIIKKLTGVHEVKSLHLMAKSWIWNLVYYSMPTVYTPFSPGEGTMQSRDEILSGMAAWSGDPWDGRSSRTSHFITQLKIRFPQFEIKDLSPILDKMRVYKSPQEIKLLRRAAEIAGLGLMEAMRSTRSEVMEYQLDAAASYIFLLNGARGPGYPSITAGGTNAWMGHYFHNDMPLKSGDLVLMDYAPDYRYYTSDVARMWPVNGKFSPVQKELYGYILKYYQTLLTQIRPGITANQVMDNTAEIMKPIFENYPFSKPEYRKGAEGTLTFRGHLSHPVGMSVHDIGRYKKYPLAPGMVLSIDPMMWIPEEYLYIRIEDTIVITDTGFENFSAFVPTKIKDIERLMREKGVVQKVPPKPEH